MTAVSLTAEYKREKAKRAYYRRKAHDWEETMKITEQEAYHQLANSCLKSAVEDWKKARRNSLEWQELVSFFMSDLFDCYCELAHVDPDWLLGVLKIECRYLRG